MRHSCAVTTDEHSAELPWYVVDEETGKQLLGPCTEAEALAAFDDYPERQQIVLRRYPSPED